MPGKLAIHVLLMTALASSPMWLGGCATIAYYAQSVSGQMEVLNQRRDVQRILADPDTPPDLRRQLALALQVRAFAVAELALPDNGSYRSYTDLQRPYVVWNVFATPALSLEPLRWCYPFAGCVSYRGYFERGEAESFARRLRHRGYDVFVGPVPAYSTLGWFDDPLLNTMIHWPEPELAGLLFHELAHQKLYVKGDSAFNESFATLVERVGVRRWMLANAKQPAYRAYQRRRAYEAQFIKLVLNIRARLAALYRSDASTDEKHLRKRELFVHMRSRYETLRRSWDGYGDFDGWMAQELNNAQIASVATYHRYVPAFERLLARHGGDLQSFYRAAASLAALPAAKRTAQLHALAPETTQDDNVPARVLR